MNKKHNSLEKGRKNILLFLILCCITPSFSQVIGVNTNPLGVFHVDGKGDNPTQASPNPQQQLNDFIILKNSKIGIGTINPNSKLHVKDRTDPLRIDGLPQSDIYTDHLLLIDDKNTVKISPPMSELMLPRPAFFRLENDIKDFLKFANNTGQTLPLSLIKNAIDGLTFDDNKSTITLPKGTYKILFNYEAIHPGCTISAYLMNFPTNSNQQEITRIPTIEEHDGKNGEHSGTISYITVLSKKTIWKLNLGRSKGIDKDKSCLGANMILNKHATQILITQIAK